MRFVIKLGGAVVTKKESTDFPETEAELQEKGDSFIRHDVLKRIATELARAKGDHELVLVNGAGPFGHVLVKKIMEGKKIHPQFIHKAVKFLNNAVVSALSSAGVAVKALDPFELCKCVGENMVEMARLSSQAAELLAQRVVPSTYGDIIPTESYVGRMGKYEGVSGDILAVELAKALDADKVIMVSDIDGVFDKNPKLFPEAQLIKVVENGKYRIRNDTIVIDVTGGLRAKLEGLARLSVQDRIRSQIINGLVPGNLTRALSGDETVGTLIR
jgi:isopentenyl phosphate kinase